MATLEKVSLKKVGYVILYVKDMAKAIAFYRDTLGIPVRFEDKNWSELETEGFTLALHQSDDIPSQHHASSPNITFKAEDIRATREALKAQGLEIGEINKVCEYDDVVGLSAEFQDPYGNKLSVYGEVPTADWKN